MESSLINWLQLACIDVLGCAEASNYALEECIVFAGKRLLCIGHDTDVLTIHNQLSEKTGVYFHPQVMTNCIKLILKYVVSPDCPEREDFVSQIISMSSVMQEHLMKAIQEESTDIPPAEEGKVIADGLQVEVLFTCDICAKKDKDIENYTRELAHAVAREKALEGHLQTENAANISKVMDLERVIVEKDQFIKSLRTDISTLQKAENEVRAMAKERVTLLQKISSLEDKIDVLEPTAQRSEAASCQLERVKEKLDMLSGIQEQLKAESALHNQTHMQLLDAQQELEALRTSKTRLEEYRERCAENSITIAELTSRLSASEFMVEQLSNEFRDLKEGSQSSERMAKQLSDELLSASETLKSFERVGGVGESMSELNPEVAKELRMLRTENDDLKAKLDMSALEALDRLQQEISDQQCVNSSLQQKWSEAKDIIKTKNEQIGALEAQVRDLKHRFSVLQSEHRETCAMAAEDNCSKTITFHAREKHVAKINRDKAALTHIGTGVVINWLSEDLHVTTETLQFTEKELSATINSKRELLEQLQTTREELETTGTKLAFVVEENMRTIDEVRREYHNEIEDIVAKGKRKIAEMEAEHTTALDLENRKADSLAADVEDERLKRRRVDRERRFYESEMQKYKSQLQVASASGGGGSLEVEYALREMKSMQDQLDATQSEVMRLKDHISSLDSLSAKSSNLSNVQPQHAPTYADSDDIVGSTQLQHSFSRQPQRVRLAAGREATSASSHVVSSKKGDSISAYVEQTELLEKRIEQMTREKRELISKNLEENKEKMEMSQKILQSEREHAALKAKMTKLTLEKERLERRIAKSESENIPPPSHVSGSLVL